MSPYKLNPSFKPPLQKQKIWRFMDLEKFEYLLNKRKLFFSSAQLIAEKYDHWEGLFPKETLSYLLYYFENHEVENVSKNAQYLVDTFKSLTKSQRPNMYLSCWHMNDHETQHMWDTYVKRDLGIVIQSNFDKLCTSLRENTESIYIGTVDYGAHLYDTDNRFAPYLNKRIQFEPDDELRCVYLNNILKKGIPLKVDLDILLENIYVKPKSTKEQLQNIQNIVDENHIDLLVQASSIDDEPPY